MTVCIGAICKIPNFGQGIVSCSDTRSVVSGSTFSDRTWKREPLGKKMFALLSGQLACGRELASMYREYLQDRSDSMPETAVGMLELLREPPRRLKRKLVEEYFQLKWAISYEDFLAGKLNSLRESELLRIDSEINNIAFPDQTYSLIGSLATGEPSLFSVYPDGMVYEEENFAVIGSGYAIARASLCTRQYHEFLSLGEALYAVYEAKKLSEGDPNVGPETAMWIDFLDHNGNQVFRPIGREIEYFQSQFDKYGPQPLAGMELPADMETRWLTLEEDELQNIPQASAGDTEEAKR